jgi:F-type H+-transporting ATPase subunit a
MFSIESAIPSLISDKLFFIGNFPVTNTVMTMLLVDLAIILIIFAYKNSIKTIPGKFQLIVEMIYSGIYGFVDQITADKQLTKLIFPISGAIFLFILLGNLLLSLPVIPAFTYDGVSLFRTITNDFNTTFAMSTSVVLIIQGMSVGKWGIFGHIFKYIKIPTLIEGFKKGPMDAFMAFIDFLLGALDIVGEIAKTISMALRLLGNVFSGEVLMALVIGLFAIALPIPVIILSSFSGIIQAIIFTALTSAYLTLALKE